MDALGLPRIALGNWRSYDLATELAQVERLLYAAADLGVRLLDTSPLYQDGDGERALGRALRSLPREAFYVATKGGALRNGGVNLTPHHLRTEVEGSLARLGVEAIDLYQLHHMDRSTPIESSLEALCRLRGEGKIRAFGLANFGPLELMEAHERALAIGDCRIASLQIRFNAIEADRAHALLEVARATAIPVMAYSVLAEGLLVGVGSLDRAAQRGEEEGRMFAEKWLVEPWLSRARAFARAARSVGMAPLELAIGFVAQEPRVSTLVLGARTVEQLAAAVRATQKPPPPGVMDAAVRILRSHTLIERSELELRFP